MDKEIPYGYCHCGCGQKTTISTQNHKKFGWVKGEPKKFIRYHRSRLLKKDDSEKKTYPTKNLCRLGKKSTVRKHILVAEKALGKKLPLKAVVHHADLDFTNYSNNNLVICQDEAYHKLIHIRTEALKQCGNANYRKCVFCKQWDDPKNMTKLSTRSTHYHKSCNNKSHVDRRSKLK